MHERSPLPYIAFVGAGPTTIYTLCAFLKQVTQPTHVTIYEQQPRAGLGTPYRPGWNDPAMLSNIASIEIPEIEETLAAWLVRQPRARLIRLGIDPDALDDRAFYPRVALGEYFLDQFNTMIMRAKAHGVAIEVITSCEVTDIEARDDDFVLSVKPANGAEIERTHHYVVLATGHQWPDEPEVRPGFFASPWPATALQRVPATHVGIRGSSLTAIDAAVAIASAHGNLVECEGSGVEFRVNPGSEGLRLVMMSRKGLLPEADFFHPIPYEPLSICTAEALSGLIADHCPTLLDDAYDLFRRELAEADPEYAGRIGLDDLALEDFADAYFADRLAADSFEWARANLAEARENVAREVTVQWRYAILRMHETVALIVPRLSEESLDRFNRHWKPVFVDDYATVPHLSIERLLALHQNGYLDVLSLGEDYQIDTHGDEPGAVVRVGGQPHQFPIFVDATGQRPLSVDAFPFRSLIEAGVVASSVSETLTHADAGSDGSQGPKGIAVDESFHPASDHPAAGRLFCLSIPYILGRHPFIQGITSSHDMGQIVGVALAEAVRGVVGREECVSTSTETAS